MVTKVRRATAPPKKRIKRTASAKPKASARLRAHTATTQAPTLAPAEITALRHRLQVSQRIFANLLHTQLKTLQNWEQGLAKPNAQAAALLLLVARRPALLEDLARLGEPSSLPENIEYERQMAAMDLIGVRYRDTLADLAK